MQEPGAGGEDVPLADPVKEEPDADRDTEDGLVISLPVADRVSDAKVRARLSFRNNLTFISLEVDSGKKGNGGDGQMKFQLNLKALDGDDPRDTAVGAGAVAVMADAVNNEK